MSSKKMRQGHEEELHINTKSRKRNVNLNTELENNSVVNQKSVSRNGKNSQRNVEKQSKHLEKPTQSVELNLRKKTDKHGITGANRSSPKSTETPEKTPKYLPFLKTHSATPVKLSKTSNKSSLIMETPKVFRKDSSLKETSLQEKLGISDDKKKNFIRSPRVLLSAKQKKKSLSVNLGHSTRKFSKSPIIVLRLPKSSRKGRARSKSDQLNLSKLNTSANGHSISPGKSKKRTKRSTSFNLGTSLTTGLDVQASDLPVHLSEKSTNEFGNITLKTAVVLLHRLPNMDSVITPSNTSAKNQISCGLPKYNLRKQTSPKYETPVKLRSTYAPNISLLNVKKISEPLMSSTPRDKIKPPPTSPPRKMSSLMLRDTTKSFSLSSETQHKKDMIEAESEPSLCDVTNATNVQLNELNGSTGEKTNLQISTPDKSEREGRNATYELLEPKTPNLRRKVREKNSFKVRFATPNLIADNSAEKSIRMKTTRLSTPYEKNRDARNSSSIDKVNFRIKFASVKVNDVTTANPASMGKSDPKFSAARKRPNFAEIHKKLFAKSESVVDAKKRLGDRHRQLTLYKLNLPKSSSNIRQAGIKQQLNEPTKGPYNKFGFKLRKNEAKNCVMKVPKETIQQQNRAILKGVRTNRRFELQMKSRKINI